MTTATLTSVRPAVAAPVRPAVRAAGRSSGSSLDRPAGGARRPGTTARTGAPVRRSTGATGGLVLTTRGRRLVRAVVLGAVTALLAVGLVLAWVTVAASVAPGASAGDGRPGVASGAGAGESGATVAVVVAPGDTLWQLARSHAPDRDPRSVVADIVELNDLGSTGVLAGTEVLVPVG